MTASDLISDYCGTNGVVRFDTQSITPSDLHWTGKVERDYNDWLDENLSGRNTTFFWEDRRSLNAFADIAPNGSDCVIAITFGSVEVLTDFFAALLAVPHILADVGDPSDEQSTCDILPISADGVPVGDIDSNKVIVPRRTPKNQERYRYSALLTNMALDFAFLHEVGHVISGHRQFRRKKYNLHTPLFAIPPKSESTCVFPYRKAMEVDADAFAVQAMTINLRNRMAVAVDPSELPDRRIDRYRMMCIAMASYFCLTAPESRGRRFYSKVYSHPYLRLGFAMDYAQTILGREESEEFLECYMTGIEDVVQAWDYLQLGNIHLAKYYEDMESLERERSDTLQLHSRLLKELEPYDLRPSDPGVSMGVGNPSTSEETGDSSK